MKNKMLIVSLLLVLCLSGCSKSIEDTYQKTVDAPVKNNIAEYEFSGKTSNEKNAIDSMFDQIRNETYVDVELEKLDYDKINTTIVIAGEQSFNNRDTIVNQYNQVTQRFLRYKMKNNGIISVSIAEINNGENVINDIIYMHSDAFANKKENDPIYFDSSSMVFNGIVISISGFDCDGLLDIETLINFREKVVETLKSMSD